MTTQKKDYYELLGVPKNASDEQLRKAFRKLAFEHHPDRNKNKNSEAKFKEINEAYQVLSDSDKRAKYDRFGHGGVSNSAGFGNGFQGFENVGGLGDIFEAFFDGFGGASAGRTRSSAQVGSDLRFSMAISFEQAVFGTKREIEIERTENCSFCKGTRAEPGTTQTECASCHGKGKVSRAQQGIFGQFVQVSTCPTCRGDGKIIGQSCSKCKATGKQRAKRKLVVDIPSGVDDDTRIRLTGEGEAGSNGARSGNLYIYLKVKPHQKFAREGVNIISQLPINVAQAAIGDQLDVDTLDGPTNLTIPSGIQSGELLRIKRKGVPSRNGNGRGDQVVQVIVVTPGSLTKDQKEMFLDLKNTLKNPESVPERDQSWFDKVKGAFVGNE
jgi:molecular chaperone DnaJ